MTAPMAGVSPWAGLKAWEDWAFHMALAPMRAWSLALETTAAATKIGAYAIDPNPARAEGAPYELSDRRFRAQEWLIPPFDSLAQFQLAREAVWKSTTGPLAGVRAHHLRRVRFMGEQWQHATSPSNFALTNPTVLNAFWRSGGASVLQGWSNLVEDTARLATGQLFFGAEAFEVGRDLAVTPGKVVFANELMELIQYTPATKEVRAEPILIVPAWIMKYYILDLSPNNSLINYLVREGYTVFCISWKNPDAGDKDRSFDDYRRLGVLAALEAVNAIVPGCDVHGVGYCLGGTMLAIAAAGQVNAPQHRLRSLTLLAAQTDFSEAGELMMFIDESQIAALEDVMSQKGYLDARQMAGAFYALRANDLLWERIVERYLMGLKKPASALDAWLADATAMPARMHSEYLRWLFLENRLAQGKLEIDGAPISLKSLQMPIFAVGAERDHIAPWRSVHKIALFASGETTFLLSGGGHNSAIVSPPEKPRAYFRINKAGDCNDYVEPDAWLASAPLVLGSWWPAWTSWLDTQSTAELRPAPRELGAASAGYRPQAPAPGQYVLKR